MSALPSPAAELAEQLSRRADAVCRRYLSNGRRAGRYWVVGDVANNQGRSLYVRLTGPSSGRGAAGKWRDAATDEHGDMLDLIRLNLGLGTLRDALDEARSFLSLPAPQPRSEPQKRRTNAKTGSTSEIARRLFDEARPIMGTPGEAYLRARGITCGFDDLWSLRFHPDCYYRESPDHDPERWPALLAAITDVSGTITAVQRTWLDREAPAKAPVADPRRSLGVQLGGGVRLGFVGDVLAVGEGLETMLSLRSALPRLPMLAGLSASHLSALELPSRVRRVYIARDNDPEGWAAEARLRSRLAGGAVEVRSLRPAYGDLNVDLMRMSQDVFRRRLVGQLAAEDRKRFATMSDGVPGAR